MTVPKKVIELIQSSGNSFHAKVARWLVDDGWHVTVSPYYLDQSLGKAREIDLIAEKLWPVKRHFGEPVSDIAVRLFIECKYVPSHSVFWFADKDTRAAEKLVCSTSPFRMDNVFTEKHHYLSESPRVAKVFASSTSRTAENDPFYKALNQVLNAMVSLRGRPLAIAAVQESRRPISGPLEFPVVVCSSFASIYAADFYNDDNPKLVSDNFQLEVQYAYVDRCQKQRDDYFLLDFVEFERLDKFIEAIDKDAQAAVNLTS